MRRRVEAEASARIDLELIDARLLQTEVELTTAKTSLQVAIMKLEQFTGLRSLHERVDSALPVPSLEETQPFVRSLNTVDWHLIAADSLVVVKARAQLKQAQNKYNAKKSEAWPQLYVRTYKPLSKVPSSTDNTMTAFVGVSYTPGAGLSTLAEAQALSTRISGAEFSIDSALLDMKQTLNADSEEYTNARSRIAALEKAIDGSELVLASYKRQFEAGKKTWLDLLNAVRELGQNQYSQADAKATMLGAMYRLQLRMGGLPH
jgi:adhesin transport system outer membrane protein